MADVVHDAQQEFWRSPTVTGSPAPLVAAAQGITVACAGCHSEFMIGARFCHTCGLRRPELAKADTSVSRAAGLLARNIEVVRPWLNSAADYWREISFPGWLRYLHFHEIQRWVGLSTGTSHRIHNWHRMRRRRRWRQPLLQGLEPCRISSDPDVADRVAAGCHCFVRCRDSAEEIFEQRSGLALSPYFPR